MKNSNPIPFLIMFLLSGTISVFAVTEKDLQTDSLIIKNQEKAKALVIGAKSLKKNRAANTAVFGDLLEVKINNLDYLLSSDDTCCIDMADTLILLSFNGMPYHDIPAIGFNRTTNSVIFHLNRNSNSLKRIAQQFTYPWEKIQISNVSICIRGNPPLPTRVTKFMLHYFSPWIFLLSLIYVLVIIVVYLILVNSTNFIMVKKNNRFSLAQSQMAFWTLLISSSVVYIWLTTNNLPDLTASTLVLMGISLATTAGAKSIPYFDKNKPPAKLKQEGFWKDILSDANGVTIHRFQMVLWTIILGFIYVQKVIFYQQITEFPETYLVLMGISSGGYVLLKTVENRVQTNGSKTSSDYKELPAKD
jgi:hypothetical protein